MNPKVSPFSLSSSSSSSPRAPLLIRAPLSFEDSSSSSELELELDDDADSLNGSEPEEAAPAPALARSASMPVARLTQDEDGEEEEEEAEAVSDDDVRVRVSVLDDDGGCNPSSDVDLDSEGVLGGNPVRVSVDNEDDDDASDDDECEVRGDQNPSLEENLDEGSILGENSNSAKYFEGLIEVGGPGAGPNPSSDEVDDDQNPNLGEKSLAEGRVLGENSYDENGVNGLSDDGSPNSSPNPSLLVVFDDESKGSKGPNGELGEKSVESDVGCGTCDANGYLDALNEDDEILGSESRGYSSTIEEVEDLEPMEPKFGKTETNVSELKDISDVPGLEKDGVLGDAEENAEKDQVLSNNSNHENLLKDKISSVSLDVLDEQDEILGSGYVEMNSIDTEAAPDQTELKSATIGKEKDESEEDIETESAEIGGIDNAKAHSNQKDKLEEGGSVSYDDEGEIHENPNTNIGPSFDEDVNLRSGCEETNTSDTEMASKPLKIKYITAEIELNETEEDFRRKESEHVATETQEIDNSIADSTQNGILDDEDGSVNVGVNGGSSSLVLYDIPETSSDNRDTVNATQATLLKDEKEVNKSEEALINSESKPQSVANGDLFEKGNGVIKDNHAVKGVANLDSAFDNLDAVNTTQTLIASESKPQAAVNDDMLKKGSRIQGTEGRIKENHAARGIEDLDSGSILRLLIATASSTSSPITAAELIRILSADFPAGLDTENTMTDEEKKSHEKIESIRVKFLRIIHRLGYSPEDNMASSILYQLAQTEDNKYWKFSLQSAMKKALELETDKKDGLNFSCNFLVLGKSGVGKSATINSIFEEEKSLTNPFEHETTKVRKIEGVVNGIKMRVLDTPGLRSSVFDQASNKKILSSVKKQIKRCPPDIVLYVDRFDNQTRDLNDLPILKLITNTLGPSIWSKTILALTNASVAPPEGPNGLALSYESCRALRSQVIQNLVRRGSGDMNLYNPVVLVENHPSCRRNREGQRVLPNGSKWRSELLLLCFSTMILAEASSISEVQDSSERKMLFWSPFRSPRMQFYLSSLLKSKPHPKFSYSDIDLDEFSDNEDNEEGDEYDQLPPFYPLTKSQVANISKEHKKAYFKEYDHRIKLLQKKQLKQELRRLKEIKKEKNAAHVDDFSEDFDGGPTTLPTLMPDKPLQPSFDSDDPIYRYRSFEPKSNFFTGYVIDNKGWDHDSGYEGVRIENLIEIARKFPASVSAKLRKDKNHFIINLDSSISNGSSLVYFEVQTVGSQLVYTFRGETKALMNFKKNKTNTGVWATLLEDTLATGVKLEDEISIGKRLKLCARTGAVHADGDMGYAANMEVTIKKKDDSINGEALALLGLSLTRYHGDLNYGGTFQSDVSIGKNSKMVVCVGLDKNKSGGLSIKTASSQHFQIVILGVIITIARSFFRRIWPGESLVGS